MSMSNKNILIIDDTVSTTMQVAMQLKKQGYNTVEANTAQVGIVLFENGKYDFVVSDLLMPAEEDGFNLLTNLKNIITSSKIDTKVIVLSASPKKEYEERCIEAGADYYIEKDKNWQEKLISIIN